MGLLRRCSLGAAAVAAAVLPLAAAATASAAPPPPAVGAGDLAAAGQAARTSSAVALIDSAAHRSVARAGAAPAASGVPAYEAGEIPVYALNPAFVRSGTGPVASLWYVATTVHQDGTTLTVFSAKQHGSWQAVNVASGDTEARLAQRAGHATLFAEPQLGAWYALAGDQVRPLNPEARQAAGAASISVTTYQHQVAARYAGRQPGSAYDKQGLAGGFDTASAPATTRSASEATGSATVDVVVPVAIAASVCIGVGLVLRRRRLPA